MARRRESAAAQPQTDVPLRRTTRGKSGTSGNLPAAGTSEPTQRTTSRSWAATSQEEPRGFAPMAGSSRNLPPVLETSLQPLVPVVPQTPARQAMNRLVTQMSAQAAMASPGPRLHAPGAGPDGESEPDNDAETSDSDPETFPARRIHAWSPRPLTQDDSNDEEIFINLNSDDENTSSVHTSPRRDSAPRQSQRASNTAEPVPSRRQHHSSKWFGFTVDADNFAWADAPALEKSKSPDCLYFFGQHTESRAYKCRLCS
ncbi:hypothetical protein K438DRAFT_1781576 [Mycena galopus ATCC 62051]|nr:hypothetical protein K438DRAFT_1781576 [Mycena galopus ATCC 62051]